MLLDPRAGFPLGPAPASPGCQRHPCTLAHLHTAQQLLSPGGGLTALLRLSKRLVPGRVEGQKWAEVLSVAEASRSRGEVGDPVLARPRWRTRVWAASARVCSQSRESGDGFLSMSSGKCRPVIPGAGTPQGADC